eukprot:12369656-Ditylum_brightwellii.AAC.1
MGELAYDCGYDIDGDIGTLYESIDHEEEMGLEVVAEEEALPVREELDALVRREDNYICNIHTDDGSNPHSDDTYGWLVHLFSSLLKI